MLYSVQKGCVVLIHVKAHQQPAAIEILTHDNESPITIHQQLLAFYVKILWTKVLCAVG